MDVKEYRNLMAEKGIEKTPAEMAAIIKSLRELFDTITPYTIDSIDEIPDPDVREVIRHVWRAKYGEKD